MSQLPPPDLLLALLLQELKAVSWEGSLQEEGGAVRRLVAPPGTAIRSSGLPRVAD